MGRNSGGSESSGCQVSDSIYPGPVYLTTKEIVSPQRMLGFLQQVKLAALAGLLFWVEQVCQGGFHGYHEPYSVYGNTVLKTHRYTTRVTEAGQLVRKQRHHEKVFQRASLVSRV